MMMTMRTIFSNETDYPNLMLMFKVFGTPTEQTWPGVTSLPYYRKDFPMLRGPNWKEAGLDGDLPMLRLCRIMLVPDPARRPSARHVLELMERPEFDMSEPPCPDCGVPVTPPHDYLSARDAASAAAE